MNAYVRKLNKLVKKPSVFFRDYFLKMAPINYGENIELLEVEKKGSASQPILVEAKKSTSRLTSEAKKVISVKTKSSNTVKKPAINKTSDNTFSIEDIYSVTFPIDIVYTWVDGDDIDFIKEKNKYLPQGSEIKPETFDSARFASRNELLYSLRSVEQYANWVNHIYIVTNGQVPYWLNINHPKVTLVPHKDIIDQQYLPTFNSHVIESCLHKIPNLSEHYIYLNDDVFFTRPMDPNYFYTSGGISKLFITNALLADGPQNAQDTPTQLAGKNSRKLIFNNFDFIANRMFAHTFHPQKKSIQSFIEEKFHEEFDLMRKNKFRNDTDLLSATFMNHHISLLLGKAIATRTPCFYFNVRSAS
ncbi:Stealth CR1 domain-containing protein, partial [Acinetobacter towneri]